MLQKILIGLSLGLSLVLGGCAAPVQKLATPSGRPEITIPKVSKKQVIDKIVSAKLERGMQVKAVTDYSVVVYQRVTDSVLASFVYGSKYDVMPEARITYSIVETSGSVKVFSRAEMVTNPGSAFERISDITEQAQADMQKELEQLKSKLSS